MRPGTMSVAKAITSGYVPLSAVLVPDAFYEVLVEPSATNGSFGHGFTYSGHPVACAVAVRNLELMEARNVVAHAKHVSARFQARLRSFAGHELVGEARGVGLIGAIELVPDPKARTPFAAPGVVGLYCSDRCLEQGLIVRNMGDVIGFCPPLVITDSEVDELFDRFGRALGATAAWVRKDRR
jgi:4-aminobutyrate--pyruvate transaminase